MANFFAFMKSTPIHLGTSPFTSPPHPQLFRTAFNLLALFLAPALRLVHDLALFAFSFVTNFDTGVLGIATA
jgi:hypothetical protein